MTNITDLHNAAVARGKHTYTDPETGYQVFTDLGLKARGQCCGSGCRHCPWHHEKGRHKKGHHEKGHHQNVPFEKRAGQIRQPAWMWEKQSATDSPASVLFWSGGKDSYLAYRRHVGGNLVLLTTFDAQLRKVAHQEISIEDIINQARALDLPLLGVPLTSEASWVERVSQALRLVPQVSQLVFGDLHLEHIRNWRVDVLKDVADELGCELAFPLWHEDYDDLLHELEASPAKFVISAVTRDELQGKIGSLYTREFALSLPDDMDRFGEHGEFHTRVEFGRGCGKLGSGNYK